MCSKDTKKSFTTQSYEVEYYVSHKHEGLRLDQFIKEQWPTLSREFIKNKIEKGEVFISGRNPPHKSSVKLHEGEKVKVVTYPSHYEDEYWNGKKIEFDKPIEVYEDQNIIVISKPAFMSTHPAGKHLFNCATVYYQTKLNHQVNSIHRLDRETSGLLLLGKTTAATREIGLQFDNSLVQKCYLLVAHNIKGLTEKSFPIEANEELSRGDEFDEDEQTEISRLKVHCFPQGSNKGKESKTIFYFLASNSNFLLLLAFPKTGRQHQIRAHAAHHGFPLVGDKIYLDAEIFKRFKDGNPTKDDHEKMIIPRQALHSIAIAFKYKNEQITFFAPLTGDIENLITQLFKITKIEFEIQAKKTINKIFNSK